MQMTQSRRIGCGAHERFIAPVQQEIYGEFPPSRRQLLLPALGRLRADKALNAPCKGLVVRRLEQSSGWCGRTSVLIVTTW